MITLFIARRRQPAIAAAFISFVSIRSPPARAHACVHSATVNPMRTHTPARRAAGSCCQPASQPVGIRSACGSSSYMPSRTACILNYCVLANATIGNVECTVHAYSVRVQFTCRALASAPALLGALVLESSAEQ